MEKKEKTEFEIELENFKKFINYCQKCNKVKNWDEIPIKIHRHFEGCTCLVCPKCSNTKEELFQEEYDEDKLYLGKKCNSCGQQNIEKLCDRVLNNMRED